MKGGDRFRDSCKRIHATREWGSVDALTISSLFIASGYHRYAGALE